MTTLNRGDSFTFDVEGRLDGDYVAVGCQTAPAAEVLRAASKVEVEGSVVKVTGLKGTVDRDGIVTVEGLTGVRVGQGDLEHTAANIEVTTPAEAPWQDGDVAIIGSGSQKGRIVHRFQGRWYTAASMVRDERSERLVRANGRWSDDDGWTTLEYWSCQPVIRGGKVVARAEAEGRQMIGDTGFYVGQQVRLIRNIGGMRGAVGEFGHLRAYGSRSFGFQPEGATTGGGVGGGIYTIGYPLTPLNRTVEPA